MRFSNSIKQFKEQNDEQVIKEKVEAAPGTSTDTFYTKEEVDELLKAQEERLTKAFLSILSPIRANVSDLKENVSDLKANVDELDARLEEIYAPIRDEKRRAAKLRLEQWAAAHGDDEEEEEEDYETI